MAESHDGLKTVRLSTSEIKNVLAESAPVHDGRFGESFDDELNAASVIWVSLGIALIMLVGFLGSWWFYQWMISDHKAADPAPTPVVAEARAQENGHRKVPSGPLLQASPEEELVEMRQEMHQLTHGYGWIDEAAGTVYIPLDKAIDKVLQRGLGKSESTETASGQEADVP